MKIINTHTYVVFVAAISLLLLSVMPAVFAADLTGTTLHPTDDANAGYLLPEGQQAASKWKHSFYRFDLSGINGGISNATFRVYYEEENAPTFYIGAVENDDWTEDGVLPERTLIHDDPALQLDSKTVNGSGYVEFNVTDFVSSQISGDGIVTLELSANTGGWNIVSSKESDNSPELIIPITGATSNLTDDANTGLALPEGQQAASKWKHSFFRFDVSGIVGGISNATFRVYYEEENAPTFYVGAVENDDWSEDGVLPERTLIHDNPELQLDSVTVTSSGYVEFNVTDFVSSQTSGDGIVTLELSANTGGWNIVSSKESDNPPELIIPTTATTINPTDDANTGAALPEGQMAVSKWKHAIFRFDFGDFDDFREGCGRGYIVSYHVFPCKATFRVYYEGVDTPTFELMSRSGNAITRRGINWSEDSSIVLTHNSFFFFNDFTPDISVTANGSGYVEFDVTNLMHNAIHHGSGNNKNIAILNLRANTGSWNIVSSRESENPPELVITDVSNDFFSLPPAKFSHGHSSFNRLPTSQGIVNVPYSFTRRKTDALGKPLDSDVTCLWEFGDGTSEIDTDCSAPVEHIYDASGEYTASLTVTDAQGRSNHYTNPKPVVIVENFPTEIDSIVFEVSSTNGLTANFSGELFLMLGNNPLCQLVQGNPNCPIDLVINFGDGTSKAVSVEYGLDYPTRLPFQIRHTYTEAGSYTAVLEARIYHNRRVLLADSETVQLEVTVTE